MIPFIIDFVCFFWAYFIQKNGTAEPSFVANLLGELEAKENVDDES